MGACKNAVDMSQVNTVQHFDSDKRRRTRRLRRVTRVGGDAKVSSVSMPTLGNIQAGQHNSVLCAAFSYPSPKCSPVHWQCPPVSSVQVASHHTPQILSWASFPPPFLPWLLLLCNQVLCKSNKVQSVQVLVWVRIFVSSYGNLNPTYSHRCNTSSEPFTSAANSWQFHSPAVSGTFSCGLLSQQSCWQSQSN